MTVPQSPVVTGTAQPIPVPGRLRSSRRHQLPGDSHTAARIFVTAALARVLVVLILVAFRGSIGEISRDSVEYHHDGLEISAQYAAGEVQWEYWIDDGWSQFIGLVYFVFGPHLILVLATNALLAGWACVLLYRTGTLLLGDERVGRVSAYLFGLFPSVVYYTSLPMKESAAVFALLGIVWGIGNVRFMRRPVGWIWIVAGLAIVAALRVYLFFVCVGLCALCLVPIRIDAGWRGIVQVGVLMATLVGLGYGAVVAAGIDLEQYQTLQYFDLDYINRVRVDMTSAGKARMFDRPEEAQYGASWEHDLWNLGKGLFHVFFSIDITNVKRQRQLAAVPEMAFLLVCLPSLFVGAVCAWQRDPRRALPILLFGTVLILVYGAAATNMGALFRWRVQALPFVMLTIVYGAAVRRGGFVWWVLSGSFGLGRHAAPPGRTDLSPPVCSWRHPTTR